MSLALGTRLGPYEIVGAIGAGGMGEVYRARDTKLHRDVALKVLPESLAGDADRVARLRREAQVLASLNHPNIGHIYGFEDSGITHALVLELVDGPTLADRIGQGPIPLSEALPIARQIADALEAAHEQGIIHRDLKPANIKVRPDGTVKVLDFGLAKALDSTTSSDAHGMNSPTLTARATQIGMILGTAAYMSPEQAAGKPVDKRSDLWGFGLVLVEMLTGRQVFQGETVSHVLAAVLTSAPDWAALPADTPPQICRLLRRCLDKDRKRRLDSAAAARLDIEDALAATAAAATAIAGGQEHALAPAPGSLSATPMPRPGFPGTLRMFQTFGWKAGLLSAMPLLLASAGVAAVLRWRQPDPAPVVTAHFTVGPPYTSGSWPRVSPDGRFLAFGTLIEGRNRFWIRALDTLEGHPIMSTTASETPFWSSNSQTLAFFADNKLQKVAVNGGDPQIVADAPHPHGGAWHGNWILFSTGDTIYRVAADGSSLLAVTQLDRLRGESQHGWPVFLPDGRRFLFLIKSSQADRDGVYLGSLEGATPIRVMPRYSRVAYGAGQLLFVRDKTLLARPFDPDHPSLLGEPQTVASGVKSHPGGDAAFDVSSTGVLVYGLQSRDLSTRLALVDRRGAELSTVADSGSYQQPRLSPDGQRVVAEKINTPSTRDLWIYGIAIPSAVKFTGANAADTGPVWSPDGKRIAFSSKRGSVFDIFFKTVDSTAPEQLLFTAPGDKLLEHWSSDGRYLVGTLRRSGLWVWPLAPRERPWRVRASDTAQTWQSEFSPDGRWLSYMSDESGKPEVYVEAFPATGARWQVSPSGGVQPHWRSDGKELFYLGADGRLMVLHVSASNWQDVQPSVLFRVSVPDLMRAGGYTVSPDGTTFVVNLLESDPVAPAIDVVVNWTLLLAK